MHEPVDNRQEYLQDNAHSGDEEDNRPIPSLLSSKPKKRARSVSTPRRRVSNQGGIVRRLEILTSHNWGQSVEVRIPARPNDAFFADTNNSNSLEHIIRRAQLATISPLVNYRKFMLPSLATLGEHPKGKVQSEHCVHLHHSARFTIFKFLRSSQSHQQSRHRRRRVPYPVCS